MLKESGSFFLYENLTRRLARDLEVINSDPFADECVDFILRESGAETNDEKALVLRWMYWTTWCGLTEISKTVDQLNHATILEDRFSGVSSARVGQSTQTLPTRLTVPPILVLMS